AIPGAGGAVEPVLAPAGASPALSSVSSSLHTASRPVRYRPALLALSAGFLVFVPTPIPCCRPPAGLLGNPGGQRYPQNFLPAARYVEAHGTQLERLTPRDYFATHGPRDVVRRALHGERRVLLKEPWQHDSWLHVLAFLGIIASLTRRSAFGRRAGALLL